MGSLIPAYRDMVAVGVEFSGLSIVQHADVIGEVVRKHKARSLLDYGCGRGDAYQAPHRLHAQWGLRWMDVTLYDPSYEQFADAPYGQFDGVLCSDVLEHVPEDELQELIGTLFKHARKFVWASVCTRPAKKTFPNGDNLHVTLQDMPWWRGRFERVATGFPGVVWQLSVTP